MANAELKSNLGDCPFKTANCYTGGTVCVGVAGGLFIVSSREFDGTLRFISLRTGDIQQPDTVARKLLKAEQIVLTNK